MTLACSLCNRACCQPAGKGTSPEVAAALPFLMFLRAQVIDVPHTNLSHEVQNEQADIMRLLKQVGITGITVGWCTLSQFWKGCLHA